MMSLRNLALVLLFAVGTWGLAACDDDDGAAERTGEAVDDAAGRAGEAVSGTAERAGEALENAGERVQDKAQ